MADVRRIPAPHPGDRDWQVRAACRGTDTSIFYHPENERGPARRHREMLAKAVCGRCPVIEPCRQRALEAREPYGVWGGMSAEDRDEALARRPA
jgi:WhiB family redox-sensing transcriptional regulator